MSLFSKSRNKQPDRTYRRYKFTMPAIKYSLNLGHYLLTLLKNETAMIVTCVYLKIKPDKINGFIEVTSENHKESVRESGNLRFDLIQRADDPSQFMLYEAYESEEAAANHKTTAHYLKWRDLAEEFMAEPRFGVRYKIIEPNDRSKW